MAEADGAVAGEKPAFDFLAGSDTGHQAVAKLRAGELDSISERASAFPMQMVYDVPITAAYLILSRGLSDTESVRFGQAMTKVWPYLKMVHGPGLSDASLSGAGKPAFDFLAGKSGFGHAPTTTGPLGAQGPTAGPLPSQNLPEGQSGNLSQPPTAPYVQPQSGMAGVPAGGISEYSPSAGKPLPPASSIKLGSAELAEINAAKEADTTSGPASGFGVHPLEEFGRRLAGVQFSPESVAVPLRYLDAVGGLDPTTGIFYINSNGTDTKGAAGVVAMAVTAYPYLNPATHIVFQDPSLGAKFAQAFASQAPLILSLAGAGALAEAGASLVGIGATEAGTEGAGFLFGREVGAAAAEEAGAGASATGTSALSRLGALKDIAMVGGQFGPSVTGGGRSLQTMGPSRIPGLQGAAHLLGMGLSGIGDIGSATQYPFIVAQNAIGHALAHAIGKNPSDPAYDYWVASLGFVGTWIGTGALAKSVAAVHSGIYDMPLDEDTLHERYGKLFQGAYKLANSVGGLSDMTDLTSSPGGRKMVRDIASVVTQAGVEGKDVTGTLMREFNGRTSQHMMPNEMARTLEYSDGSHQDVAMRLNEYFATLGLDRSDLIARMDAAQFRLDNTADLSSGEKAQLQAEVATDKARLGAPAPMVPELRPRLSLARRLTIDTPKLRQYLGVLYDPVGWVLGKWDRPEREWYVDEDTGKRRLQKKYTIDRKWQTTDEGRKPVTTGAHVGRQSAEVTFPVRLASFFRDTSAMQRGLDDPFHPDAPMDAFTHNVRLVEQTLQFAGARSSEIDTAVTAMANVHNESDFYDANHLYVDTLAGVQARKGAYAGDPMATDLTRIANTDRLQADYGTADDGRPVIYSTETDPGGATRDIPRPAVRSQLLNGSRAPDAEALFETTRLRRNVLREMGALETGGLPPGEKALAVGAKIGADAGFNVWHSAAEMERSFLRPPNLAARSVRILVSSIMQSGLMRYLDPSLTAGFRPKERLYEALAKDASERVISAADAAALVHDENFAVISDEELPDGQHKVRYMPALPEIERDPVRAALDPKNKIAARRLGQFMDDQVDRSSGTKQLLQREQMFTRDREGHPATLVPGVTRALYDSIRTFSADQAVQRLVGWDPERLATWLREDPEGQAYARTMLPEGQDLNEYATRLDQALRRATGGDPDLYKALKSWKWKTQSANPVDAEKMRDLDERIAGIDENLANVRMRDPSRPALLLERANLEASKNILGMSVSYTVDLRDEQLMRQELGRASLAEDGRFKLPDQLWVRSYDKLRDDPQSAVDKGYKGLYRVLGFVSGKDVKYARGPMMYDYMRSEYQRLRSYGVSVEDARAEAMVHAATYTAEMNYSLGQRSSFETQMRNTFWYAPYARQFFERWFIHLPRRYGYVAGYGLLFARAAEIQTLFKGLGLLSKNSFGESVIRIPGTNIELNESSLVLGAARDAGLYPAPLQGIAIKKAGKYIPAFNSLSNAIGLYNAPTFLGQITKAYEAVTGKRPPWEFQSPAMQDQILQMAQIRALRIAISKVGPPPSPSEFLAKYGGDTKAGLPYAMSPAAWRAFQEAQAHWTDETLSMQHSIASGHAMVSLIVSTLTPASISFDDPLADKYMAFYDKWHKAGVAKPGWTDAETAFLAKNPNLYAYSIYETQIGNLTTYGKDAAAGTDVYTQLDDGARSVLPLQARNNYDYIHYAQGMAEYRLLHVQYAGAIKALENGDPLNLIRGGYDRESAVLSYWQSWNDYLTTNPNFVAMMADQRLKWDQLKDVPVGDPAVNQLLGTIQTIRELAKGTSADGIRSQDMLSVMGTLSKQLAAIDTSKQSPDVARYVKTLRWYTDTVSNPYYTAVDPLYVAADEASQLDNGDASAIYDKIRAEQWSVWNKQVKTPDGQTGTLGSLGISPEQTAFGKKSPHEQLVATLKWTAEPLWWLGPGAFSKVLGRAPTEPEWKALSQISTLATEAQSALATASAQGGGRLPSGVYQKVQQALATYSEKYAQDVSPEFGQAIALSFQSPAARIVAFGHGDPWLRKAQESASQVWTMMQTAGIDPRSDYGRAAQVKAAFFNQLDNYFKADPTYYGWLSLAMKHSTEKYVVGATLWDRLFFDSGWKVGGPFPDATAWLAPQDQTISQGG